MTTGILLVLIGLFAILTQKDLIRIIVGFSIFDIGVHVIMISIGYISDATAPIIENLSQLGQSYVDPVPQALVLTAIVIGLGISAFMLTFAVFMFKKRGSLDINSFRDLKW
ncbi:MAG: NADH-quinone oxidoreductase subunit K [Deltaproteobacteria bacterium]|nr:NADH-quinone oxidoreductase subunit K [Deltaproteobacteria bacterium]